MVIMHFNAIWRRWDDVLAVVLLPLHGEVGQRLLIEKLRLHAHVRKLLRRAMENIYRWHRRWQLEVLLHLPLLDNHHPGGVLCRGIHSTCILLHPSAILRATVEAGKSQLQVAKL